MSIYNNYYNKMKLFSCLNGADRKPFKFPFKLIQQCFLFEICISEEG